jgi:hypothetical protein
MRLTSKSIVLGFFGGKLAFFVIAPKPPMLFRILLAVIGLFFISICAAYGDPWNMNYGAGIP